MKVKVTFKLVGEILSDDEIEKGVKGGLFHAHFMATLTLNAIPRIGESFEIDHSGGVEYLKVEDVSWQLSDTDDAKKQLTRVPLVMLEDTTFVYSDSWDETVPVIDRYNGNVAHLRIHIVPELRTQGFELTEIVDNPPEN